MIIRHEYDRTGQHRLVARAPRSSRMGPAQIEGDWTGYQAIATVTAQGTAYFAITAYHEGGTILADKIYEFKVVSL